ncbi:MipA/OmpV family protein [Marinicella gelatinilytica]|uniref:MipA/OmpV family protein n=1 Tax=Marinicella gelatinilytica TaxID=2996017 RepID=UPI002260E548|nr:MipA/OmpV family protein [Marinicella gelatinilytica]MCX7545779.1 MipA/OmpV family protein [Marinicella gelatinilytica]
MIYKRFIPTLTLLLMTSALLAQDDIPDDHRLRVGVAAVSSNSIYLNGERQNVVFPAFDYEYKNFYFQAGDAGYKILDQKIWQLDVGLSIDFSGDVDRGDSPLFTHLPDLHYPLYSFVTFGALTDYGLFDVRYDHEINNKHNGHIISANYTAYFKLKDWKFYPKLSQRRYSGEFVNYFYGVDTEFANDELPAYRGQKSDVTELSLTILKNITPQWYWVSSVRNQWFNDEITNSPLVDDDQRLSLFIGVLYEIF